MAGKNIVGLVMGSRKDVDPHSKLVAEELRKYGWARSEHGHIYVPSDPAEKVYTVNGGSVHRDLDGTVAYVNHLSDIADSAGDRLIFLTCVGRRDEASGVISSYTGKRVAAIPPAAVEYGKYPDGLMVFPFSKNADRSMDIAAGVAWINEEFKNPEWEALGATRKEEREKAKSDLLKFRDELQEGKIVL